MITERLLTSVSEQILQRDEEAKKHMPKVMQDQVKNSPPSGSRSFSTYTRFAQEMQKQNSAAGAGGSADPSVELVANMITDVSNQAAEKQGLKFPAPESLPASENFRERYDSVLKLFTNMIMTSGKLTRAQRVCSPFSSSTLLFCLWFDPALETK